MWVTFKSVLLAKAKGKEGTIQTAENYNLVLILLLHECVIKSHALK